MTPYNLKKAHLALLTMGIIFGICNNKMNAQTIIKNDSIRPYIQFLEDTKFVSAKEYVLSKFDIYDIVILSERHHAEMTQYEVILDIVKDERFKGHIYTEVGQSNFEKRLNDFLRNSTFTEKEKEMELLNVYREIMSSVFVWDKYNYYHLLSEVWNINKNRKEEDKVLIFPTNIAFDFNDCETHREWVIYNELSFSADFNDIILGQNFVRFYERIKSQRPKALVIQNTYHGYTRIPIYLPLPTRPEIYSVGEYIYKSYPDKTFNIYINGTKSVAGMGDLSSNGIIDAAFAYTKMDNIGFDLKNTPIGNTKFDLYNFGRRYDTVNFSYIFDGMIFYKLPQDFVLKWNIPNIYPKEHEEQFFKRLSIILNQPLEDAKSSAEFMEFLERINTPVEKSFDKEILEAMDKLIKKWIE